jgi:hypothetical protein
MKKKQSISERMENLGYRLGYRLHGRKPPTDEERIGKLIDESLAGKPDWAMSVRLAAANVSLMQSGLKVYLDALEKGEEQKARSTAVDIRKNAEAAAVAVKQIPLADSPDCVDALEGIAVSVSALAIPERSDLATVAAFIREHYC